MTRTALVVGATGITGSAVARQLVAEGWKVHGLARRPQEQDGVAPVAADLLDPQAAKVALADIHPDAVFLTTWLRRDSEAQNIRVNGAMVRNLLAALPPAHGARHVALVTGLKHYLGPFEPTARATCPRPPSARTRGGSMSRTSITRRRTSCSPRPSGMASPGRSTARTR
ncbi:hypothetical protein MBENS4_3974 [Novosphingobium sp. MBES04]|nr:hypothetical protein MBENS4_3974 [Novosphingobium sp. MBES04]